MGDVVQHVLEETIPELEDLWIHGVFSQQEIREIVRKRRDFEYLVRRVHKEKIDFLRYIQYELNLDLLRRKRFERLNLKNTAKTTEHAALRRIHGIFRRALKKYRGDVKLWLQYVDFSLQCGSARSLDRTFIEALRLHPEHEGLWILAASWEYEYNQNIIAARALLQRALRLNPKSSQVYLEYCRLELIYRDRVRRKLKIGDEEPFLTPTGHSIDISLLPDVNTKDNIHTNVTDNNTNREIEERRNVADDSTYETFYDDKVSENEEDGTQTVTKQQQQSQSQPQAQLQSQAPTPPPPKSSQKPSSSLPTTSVSAPVMPSFISLSDIEGDPAYSSYVTHSQNSTNVLEQQKKMTKEKTERIQALKGNPFLEGAIVRAIIKHAISTHPSDFELRFKILTILRHFAHTTHLQDEIYDSLLRDFPENEEVLSFVAQRPVHEFVFLTKFKAFKDSKKKLQPTTNDNTISYFEREDPIQEENRWIRSLAMNTAGYRSVVEKTMDCFDVLVKKYPTRRMWFQYLHWMTMNLSFQLPSLSPLLERCYRTFSSLIPSLDTSFHSEEILLVWLQFHQFVYQIQSLLQKEIVSQETLLRQLQTAVKLCPTSAKIQEVYLRTICELSTKSHRNLLSVSSRSDIPIEHGEVLEAFDKALKCVERTQSTQLWIALLSYCIDNYNFIEFDETLAYFEKALESHCNALDRVKEDVITKAIASLPNPQQIRLLYKRALELKPWTLSLVQRCIDFETNQEEENNQFIRSLFEIAVNEYGETSAQLWLQYIAFEHKNKEFKRASALYWRAQRALKDASVFVHLHSEFVNERVIL